ncbi:hypothetical protein Phum_PHUM360570 [Pediculus humanus corporis]|uniref:Uncharacterized protein n=1 Tax=Pediculus humanus subsp. corporis TaxID=121224 RepID=E0VPJ1_PEDHC|nr:uncharacterized protein Phum_PHUM360570 [Pediculus humanus corporis]EEB15297.1 hypothetical protein Phum_PHUM360570 [Pediculus humanus corporis]
MGRSILERKKNQKNFLPAVARMVRFWNIPLLTTGALTFDFAQNKTSCKNDFHLLVRTGVVDFQEISNFILKILHRYVSVCFHSLPVVFLPPKE